MAWHGTAQHKDFGHRQFLARNDIANSQIPTGRAQSCLFSAKTAPGISGSSRQLLGALEAGFFFPPGEAALGFLVVLLACRAVLWNAISCCAK